MKTIRIFFGFWWLVIRRAAQASLKAVDLRSQAVQSSAGLLLLLILSLLAAYKILPDAVSELLRGDAFSVLRFVLVTIFILGLALFMANLVYQPAIFHEDESRENRNLRQALKPILSILFAPGDPYKYLVTGKSADGFGQTFPFVQVVYRIGVKSLSPTTPVDNVCVELEAIEPRAISPLPLTLHQMHDNPPDQSYLSRFNLNPGETKFIDVISRIESSDPQLRDQTRIWHIVPGITPFVPPGTYDLTVHAHARNSPDTRRTFVARMDAHGDFSFAPK